MARLTIEGVGKTYRGGVQALVDLSLEIEPGVLGLLGPNGAGKSTLMRILATITRPTAGRVLWEGEDVFRSRAAARRLRNLLSELAGDRIVILSTHIVSDVEAAAGVIALVAAGRLVSLAPSATSSTSPSGAPGSPWASSPASRRST